MPNAEWGIRNSSIQHSQHFSFRPELVLLPHPRRSASARLNLFKSRCTILFSPRACPALKIARQGLPVAPFHGDRGVQVLQYARDPRFHPYAPLLPAPGFATRAHPARTPLVRCAHLRVKRLVQNPIHWIDRPRVLGKRFPCSGSPNASFHPVPDGKKSPYPRQHVHPQPPRLGSPVE